MLLILSAARCAAVFFLAALLSGGPAFASGEVLQPRNDILAPAPSSAPADIPAETLPAPAPLPESTLPPAPEINTKSLNLETGPAPKRVDPDAIDPAKVPDVLMQEVNEIENSCNGNYFLSSFHDCRCIAVKFLDARAKSDPKFSRDAVFQSIMSECPNTTAIAGFVYSQCYDHMKIHRPDDYRQFCECGANRMAERYTEQPFANLRHIERLRRNAFIECGSRNNSIYQIPPAYRSRLP